MPERLWSIYRRTGAALREKQENRADPEDKIKSQLLHCLGATLMNTVVIQHFAAEPFIGSNKVIWQPELSEGSGGKVRWQLEMFQSDDQTQAPVGFRLTVRGNLKGLRWRYGTITIRFKTSMDRVNISKTVNGREVDLTNEFTTRGSLKIAIEYLERYGEISAENNGVTLKSEESEKGAGVAGGPFS